MLLPFNIMAGTCKDFPPPPIFVSCEPLTNFTILEVHVTHKMP